jgi:hypothetical protein
MNIATIWAFTPSGGWVPYADVHSLGFVADLATAVARFYGTWGAVYNSQHGYWEYYNSNGLLA